MGEGSDNSATYFMVFECCMVIDNEGKCSFNEDNIFVEYKLTKWPPWLSYFFSFGF
jgi:hypothetical protein